MTIGDLIRAYLSSPAFTTLSENSQRKYNTYIAKISQAAGGLPVKASEYIPKRVAVAHAAPRSPKGPQKTYVTGRSHAEFDPSASPTLGVALGKVVEASGETPVAKNAAIAALSAVYTWGIRVGILPVNDNPVPYLTRYKHERRETQPFTKEEIDHIYNFDWPASRKPYAMVTVLSWETAARPDELFNVETNHFTTRVVADETLFFMAIYKAKGRVAGELGRYIQLSQRALDIIKWFLAEPSFPGTEKYAFRNAQGGQMNYSSYYWMSKKICAEANLNCENRVPYDTRKGAATHMKLEGKKSMEQIQHLLGHASAATTRRYVFQNKMGKAIEAGTVA